MTYSANVVCENCGWEGEVDIEGGVLVGEKECPICECLTLRRHSMLKGWRKAEEVEKK